MRRFKIETPVEIDADGETVVDEIVLVLTEADIEDLNNGLSISALTTQGEEVALFPHRRSGRTISVPEFGLEIVVNGQGSGVLKASKIGLDQVESLVLAHACAGVDVTAPAYVEGLRVAIDAITNHLECD